MVRPFPNFLTVQISQTELKQACGRRCIALLHSFVDVHGTVIYSTGFYTLIGQFIARSPRETALLKQDTIYELWRCPKLPDLVADCLSCRWSPKSSRLRPSIHFVSSGSSFNDIPLSCSNFSVYLSSTDWSTWQFSGLQSWISAFYGNFLSSLSDSLTPAHTVTWGGIYNLGEQWDCTQKGSISRLGLLQILPLLVFDLGKLLSFNLSQCQIS